MGINKYTDQLERSYKIYCESSEVKPTKLQFAGDELFEFTTYDSGIDGLFASKMTEVIEVLINHKNFEYIQSKEKYINYLLMVNMPFLTNKIEWGTSIRGAWIDDVDFSETVYQIGNIEVKKEDIKVFLTDLINWIK